jgi:Domain of unknown function (DUF4157)
LHGEQAGQAAESTEPTESTEPAEVAAVTEVADEMETTLVPQVTEPADAMAATPVAQVTEPAESEAEAAYMRGVADPGEPVSQAMRRFLRPLVGIDPVEVRLHRGEVGAEVTSAHGADAVTIGRNIFFAPGQGEMDPRGMGLLAHELTHVARRPQPDPALPTVGSESSRATTNEGQSSRARSSLRKFSPARTNEGDASGHATTDQDYSGRATRNTAHSSRATTDEAHSSRATHDEGQPGRATSGQSDSTRAASGQRYSSRATTGESDSSPATSGDREFSDDTSDVELLARQVEANVRGIAERASGGAVFQAGPTWAVNPSAGASTAGASGVMRHSAVSALRSTATGTATPSDAALTNAGAGDLGPSDGAWNGLPAPWEPLPDWLTTPGLPAGRADAALPGNSARSTSDTGYALGSSSDAAASAVSSTSYQGYSDPGQSSFHGYSAPGETSSTGYGAGSSSFAVATAGMAEAAEIGRDLPAPDGQTELAAQPANPPTHAGGVEPDLDALARQVYTLLRRRLASERRRFN